MPAISLLTGVLEEESAPSAQAKKPLSRKYVDAIMGVVSEVMSSSAVAESSLQYEADDEDKRRKRKLRLDALPKGRIKDDETAEAVTLQHGKMPKKIWMQVSKSSTDRFGLTLFSRWAASLTDGAPLWCRTTATRS